MCRRLSFSSSSGKGAGFLPSLGTYGVRLTRKSVLQLSVGRGDLINVRAVKVLRPVTLMHRLPHLPSSGLGGRTFKSYFLRKFQCSKVLPTVVCHMPRLCSSYTRSLRPLTCLSHPPAILEWREVKGRRDLKLRKTWKEGMGLASGVRPPPPPHLSITLALLLPGAPHTPSSCSCRMRHVCFSTFSYHLQ